jgi:hypothetical protein
MLTLAGYVAFCSSLRGLWKELGHWFASFVPAAIVWRCEYDQFIGQSVVFEYLHSAKVSGEIRYVETIADLSWYQRLIYVVSSCR